MMGKRFRYYSYVFRYNLSRFICPDLHINLHRLSLGMPRVISLQDIKNILPVGLIVKEVPEGIIELYCKKEIKRHGE